LGPALMAAPANRCGQPHEAAGLDYLGPCVADQDHDGPHEFVGPIEGTVISVTLGDGWKRTRTRDADELLDALGPALRATDEPPC
jgi:hypothetical protein